MPIWLAIVMGVFVGLVLMLAVGGVIARRRQLERTQGRFDEHLAQVNQDLAAAHAEDRGWEREALDAARSAAWAAERPGAPPASSRSCRSSTGRARTRTRRSSRRVGPQGRAAHARPPRRRVGPRGDRVAAKAPIPPTSRARSASRGSSSATAATACGAGASSRPAIAT